MFSVIFCFQSVFNEIRIVNLTSQISIDNIESNPLPLDINLLINLNWQDFTNCYINFMPGKACKIMVKIMILLPVVN